MSRTLRIVIADDEGEIRDYLHEGLTRLGHQVVAIARNGRELIEKCRDTHPDLAVADIRMPELDGLQAAESLNRDNPTPVLLLSAHHEPELLASARADYIIGYLVKPISEPNLKTAIAVGMDRFERFQALAEESAVLRQSLEDRKLIEKAKGILMHRLQISEDEAFRRLRKRASDQNLKLIEVARQIIGAEDIFHHLDRV
jgi:response regulator NasT